MIVGAYYRLRMPLFLTTGNGETKEYPANSIVRLIGKTVNTDQGVDKRLTLEFDDGVYRAFGDISHRLALVEGA